MADSAPDRTNGWLDQGSAPLALADRSGLVLSFSPPARDMLVTAGWSDARVGRNLPVELWTALEQAAIAEPVEWGVGERAGTLGVTRYAQNPSTWLLVMRELTVKKATLAHQLYRSTQEEFARLIAAAAHDLRSPLSSMTFNVGVLRRRFRELEPTEAQKLLDEIYACCEWQDRAITTLVESSKGSDADDVTLASLFERVEQLLRPMFRERQGGLKVAVDGSLRVRGTTLQLEHIFVNLISNAVHSREAAVCVEVRQGSLAPAGSQRRGLVSLEVSDDGPGVAEEIRARIFDPFFTTKVQGSGVGLCLAREAARALGGDLVLLPVNGPGATFEVKLEVMPEGASA